MATPGRAALDTASAGQLGRAAEAASRAARTTHSAEMASLPPATRRRALARLVALNAWRAWCRSLGSSSERAAALFVAAWRKGAVVRPPQVATDLPSFTSRSLRAWKRIHDSFGPAPLGGAYRPPGFKIARIPPMRRIAEAALRRDPGCTRSRLHALLRARFGASAPSEGACLRWLAVRRGQGAAS
jgi:hypothetical protein